MTKTEKKDKRLHGLELSLRDLVKLKLYAHGIHFKNTKKTAADLSGSQRAVTYGRGMDFAEVRVYQTGDDIRTMDWRVTARTGKPHTKLFREEREQPVYLILNLSSSMQFGTQITFKSIIAMQIAALLAWKATINKDRVGGFIFNNTTHHFAKPLAGNRGILPFLQNALTLNQLSPTITISNQMHALMKYRTSLKHGNKIFVINDFLDFNENIQKFYSQLAKTNQLHFFHIYDMLEAEAPKSNIYSVSDGTNIFQFDSSSTNFQEKYNQRFITHLDNLKQYCLERKIHFNSIRTDADVIAILQGIQ